MKFEGNKSEFFLAFAKLQADYPTIPKNRTANVKTKSGGQYSFSYADLSDILNALRPVLAKHSFSVSQPLDNGTLFTIIGHPSGTWEMECALPSSHTPQEFGGILTYYRRYCLCTVLGIAADEDTDASLEESDASKLLSPIVVRPQPAQVSKPVSSLNAESALVSVPESNNKPEIEQSRAFNPEITYGKFKGKKCSEVGHAALKEYVDELLAHPNFSMDKLSDIAKMSFTNIEAYLNDA